MPYVVWMCQNTLHAETRIQYCFAISELFDVVWGGSLQVGSQFLPTSFTDTLRQRANIYDAVADHTDYFCELLTANDDWIRLACFDVLRWLADEHLEILPHLVTCFQTTTNIWVQTFAIWYYALFAKRDWQHKKSSADQLYRWMQSDNDLQRFTAALGRLHLHPVRSEDRDAIPDAVLDTVVDYFDSDVWGMVVLPGRDAVQRLVRQVLPYDARMFDLLRGVALNQSEPFFWLELLKRIDLNPINAHRHCRELLRSAFLPAHRTSTNVFWDDKYHSIEAKAGEPIIYNHYRTERNWQDVRLDQRQRAVLEFIVNCDLFWEHPTNLFSHYYGLPDERNALQKLL